MKIEEAYQQAQKRLLTQIRETNSVLKKTSGNSHSYAMASGGVAIIYANEIHGICVEEAFKCLQQDTHPVYEIKRRMNEYFDEQIAKFEQYKKDTTH